MIPKGRGYKESAPDAQGTDKPARGGRRGRPKGTKHSAIHELLSKRDMLATYEKRRTAGRGYEVMTRTVRRWLWNFAPTVPELRRLLQKEGRTRAEADAEIATMNDGQGPKGFHWRVNPHDPAVDRFMTECRITDEVLREHPEMGITARLAEADRAITEYWTKGGKCKKTKSMTLSYEPIKQYPRKKTDT